MIQGQLVRVDGELIPRQKKKQINLLVDELPRARGNCSECFNGYEE